MVLDQLLDEFWDFLIRIRTRRKIRHTNEDSVASVRYIEPSGTIGPDGLFDHENPPLFGKSRHQVLRPLENEIPSQMAKANYVKGWLAVFDPRKIKNCHL